MHGCFPTEKFDNWSFFGTNIVYFLKYGRSLPFAENTKENLKLVDDTLAIYEESLPKEIRWEKLCKMLSGDPVSKLDISIKLLDFLSTSSRKLDSNKDYHEVLWNCVKDFRRVIRRALNDEPFYLIPEQTKSFINFAGTLCYAPRRMNFEISGAI